MKLPYLHNFIVICFFAFFFHPKSAAADDYYSGENSCGGTARINSVVNSTIIDPCYGTAYFFISTDTNCSIKSVLSNSFDSLIWLDSFSTYQSNYGIAKGTTKSESGGSLCGCFIPALGYLNFEGANSSNA